MKVPQSIRTLRMIDQTFPYIPFADKFLPCFFTVIVQKLCRYGLYLVPAAKFARFHDLSVLQTAESGRILAEARLKGV